MKKIILAGLLMVMVLAARAEVGISGAYRTAQPGKWLDALNQEQYGEFDALSGYQLGIDTWFRLKKFRIEFFPELAWSAFDQTSADYSVRFQIIGFHFNTQIYLFDLEGDCNCPTFSKSGNLLKKGFFFQLSPGVIRFNNELTGPVSFNDQGFAWELGGGVGVDLGISDFLTVTPLVKYLYTPSATWDNFELQTGETAAVESEIGQFYAGLRLGFRFKPERSFGRR